MLKMSGLLVLERYKVVTNSWFLGGNGLQQANLSYGLLTLDFIFLIFHFIWHFLPSEEAKWVKRTSQQFREN